MGLPVVCTNHNGFGDSVLNGQSGFLVPERNVDALSTRLADLIRQSELWPGIGRKGAQRIVLELAGRLGSPGEAGDSAGPRLGGAPQPASWRDQVRAALVSLGWQGREADQAIAAIEPQLDGQASGGDVDVPTALKAALQLLGRA